MEEEKKEEGKKSYAWAWIVGIAVIVLLAAIYYFIFAANGNSANSALSQNNNITSGQNSVVAKVKFSDTSDSKNAYLISTDSYDSATQAALAGFKVERNVLADGTQQINLVAQNPEYQSQSYTVKPGEKLYFVERYMGDDPNGEEQNMGDDLAVLVDADGYIVQQ